MYFNRQQCVVGAYKSCEKVPVKSEYVPVVVTPISADFEEGLLSVLPVCGFQVHRIIEWLDLERTLKIKICPSYFVWTEILLGSSVCGQIKLLYIYTQNF